MVILLFVVYNRRRRPEQYVVGVDPEDDVRENIIHYDEEGVGEYYSHHATQYCIALQYTQSFITSERCFSHNNFTDQHDLIHSQGS